MEGGGFLMMIFGALLIFIWIMIEVGKTQNRKQVRKSEELDTKIKYQNFILAVKQKFPQAQYKRYGYGIVDYTILTTSIFNTNRKKIGVIELSGSRDSWVRNAPITFDVSISISMADKTFDKKVTQIDDKVEDIYFYIDIMLAEIYNNPDFQKIFVALNI